ncbi:flagellar export protein FliJ [Shouchella shacheensis]|uniref:flagellar export protein FliJ n=1 Tax=Shouchella shacheensis TaxID=1649580 RepID=UPI0015D5B471|nr:flagellar export protein FliJ [Shouchella shacheensis]
MSFSYSLQHVMNVCKQQKDIAEQAYREASGDFEEVATTLYHLLKRKEDLESSLEETLDQRATVLRVMGEEKHLEWIRQRIVRQEKETEQARRLMQHKKNKRDELALAYKQYERIREQKQALYEEEQKKLEAQTLDELASSRFIRRRQLL